MMAQENVAPETSELQAALQELLTAGPLAPRQRVELTRRPSPYSSSYPLEELDVRLADDRRFSLIFKDLSPLRRSPVARGAKPAFLDDPEREIAVYRDVLSDRGLGTAAYVGSFVAPAAGHYWLFLENVAGRELYQVGEFDIWCHVARWLGDFHRQFHAAATLGSLESARLPRYDHRYYESWLQRTLAFSALRSSRDGEEHQTLLRLAARYDEVVSELWALPSSLIHGEFYASNILVQNLATGLRICPVDWERAAWGPGLIDLAALTAGNWTDPQKADLTEAYFASFLRDDPFRWPWPDLIRGLELCRLHLAVQWLGWSLDWSPPAEHRHDWLAEASRAACRLGLMEGQIHA